MFIDVFNGDADGICALHQLRLANPVNSQLITGVKRDIKLLERVTASAGDNVLVLDISLDKNRESLIKLLDKGVKVRYIDHHFAGDIPQQSNLDFVIDTKPDVCTSLLVNEILKGQYLLWAVTAAYGDNLFESAENAAKLLALSRAKLNKLKTLGICINYNGYGAILDDLYFHPAVLYEKLKPYSNPFDFIEQDEVFQVLNQGYRDDLTNAAEIQAEMMSETSAVYILPNAKWARRVSGVFSNDLAQTHPQRAHAVLIKTNDTSYQVSVRAPLQTKIGADTLCRKFETGGGRQAAAGVNVLPESDFERFINMFSQHFSGCAL